MADAILQRIMDDIKAAMKAQEKEKLLALRTLHSEIKNVGINQRKEVTDEDVATVIAKGIKQREDSIAQFRAAGREDLASREQDQIYLYRQYQLRQLERAEIEAIVTKAVAESGATSKRDIGKVMKLVMPQVKGRADGKLVNQIVGEKLP